MALTDQNFNPIADALRAVEEERERRRRASMEGLMPRISEMMRKQELAKDPIAAPPPSALTSPSRGLVPGSRLFPMDDPVATLGRRRAERDVPKREPDVFPAPTTDPRALIPLGMIESGPSQPSDPGRMTRDDPDLQTLPSYPAGEVPLEQVGGAPSSGGVPTNPYNDMERYPFTLAESEGSDMAFTLPESEGVDMSFGLPEAEGVDMAFRAPARGSVDALPDNPYTRAPDMAFDPPEAEGVDMSFGLQEAHPIPLNPFPGGDVREETQDPEFMARVKAVMDEMTAEEEARTPGRLRRLPEPRPRSLARYRRNLEYNRAQQEIARGVEQRSTEQERQQREVEEKYMREMDEQTMSPDSARETYNRARDAVDTPPLELDELWRAAMDEQEGVARGLEAGGTRLRTAGEEAGPIVGGRISPHRAETRDLDLERRMLEDITAETATPRPATRTPGEAPADDYGLGLAQVESDIDQENQILDAIAAANATPGAAPGAAPGVPQQVTPISGETPQEPQPPSPADPDYEREMRQYEQDLRAWRGAMAAQAILGIGTIVGAAGGAPAEALGGLGETSSRVGQTYREGAAGRGQARSQAAQRRQRQAQQESQMALQRRRFDETVRQGERAEETRALERDATRRATAEETRGDEPLTPEQIEAIAGLATPEQRDSVRQRLQGGTHRDGQQIERQLLTRPSATRGRVVRGGGSGRRVGGSVSGQRVTPTDGSAEVGGVIAPVGAVPAGNMRPTQARLYNQGMTPEQRADFEYGFRPPGWFGIGHPGFPGSGAPRNRRGEHTTEVRARVNQRSREVSALGAGGVSHGRIARNRRIAQAGFDRVADAIGADNGASLWLLTAPSTTPTQRGQLANRISQAGGLQAAASQYQRAQADIERISPGVSFWNQIMAQNLSAGGSRAAAAGIVDQVVPGQPDDVRMELVNALQRQIAARESMIGLTREIERWGALTIGEHTLASTQLPTVQPQATRLVETQSANQVRLRVENLAARAQRDLNQVAESVRNTFAVTGLDEALARGIIRPRRNRLRGVRRTIADLERVSQGGGEDAAVAHRALRNLRIRLVQGRQQ